MKNIFKLFLIAITAGFIFVACNNDLDTDWATPEPSFKLHDTTLGSNVLYSTMEGNPFILTWDNTVNVSSDYTVVISATEDFASKVQLGTSATNTFKTTIGTLNIAMLQAGLNPYSAQTIYVRIESGNAISNTISFRVTPYPVAVPIITLPTGGTSFVLDAQKATQVLTKITWSDYAQYGVDVKYSVAMAKKGSATYEEIAVVTNTKEFELTHSKANDVVIKLGATPNVAAEYDVKVTATTETTGVITKVSAPVTIKITPYESNVPLFLIGDATAGGWDNSTGNNNMFPLLANKTAPTKYTFTGRFSAGGFKIIKVKGSWDAQYGKGSADGQLSTDGGSGNISVPSAGYYKLSIDVAQLTYTLEPVSTPTVTYTTVGIIGDSTPNGWDGSTAMTKSAFDPNMWVVDATLTNGEMKFRANNSWDVNWGSGDENFGTATSGGANIPVKAGGYLVYFNDSTGAYTLIKK